MAKKPNPPLNSTSQVTDGDKIAAEHLRYLTSVDAALRELIGRFSVPVDAGAWPTAAQIPAGDGRLWKNGAAVRLYVNDAGTLRFVALT